MDYKYKQLEQEVSALGKVFTDLGAYLSDVAKQVAAPGVTPPEKLIEQIQTARTNFDTVRTTVHAHAASMLVSPLPKLAEVTSITAVLSLLKMSAASEENKLTMEGERDRALAILGNVLSIHHREAGDFKPLQDCLAKISELKDAIGAVLWPQRHPQSESIVTQKHPATALLRFVEGLDTLEDERWMALEAIITESYGKPLFVAASRGKLAASPAKPAEKVQIKPTPAVEKPVEKPLEKKVVVEKPIIEKPAPAPVIAAEKKVPQPAAVGIPEKKEQVQVVAPKPTPTVVVPVPVVSVPATPVVVAPPAPSAPAPAATAPAAAIPTPARPVAAVVPPAVAPPAVASPVAPVAAAPSAPAPSQNAAISNSLTALANATEPLKTPSASAAEIADKLRKEPRLAAPGPSATVKSDARPSEGASEEAQTATAGDGSQRPQRWGFWRGNR